MTETNDILSCYVSENRNLSLENWIGKYVPLLVAASFVALFTYVTIVDTFSQLTETTIARKPIVLAHVICPYVSDSRNNEQQITMESMRRAKRKTIRQARVELYGAVLRDDQSAVPSDFVTLPYLNRTTATEYPGLLPPRQMPFLDDILSRLYKASPNADYYIYTNVDIGVQVNFYDRIMELIDMGYDAFSINRRTIDREVNGTNITADTLDIAYQQDGEKHPGHDCFVFKRDIRISYHDVFLGFPYIGKIMVESLTRHAQNYTIFREEHLTFHLGHDKAWTDPALRLYMALNVRNGEIACPGCVEEHKVQWAEKLLANASSIYEKSNGTRTR